MIEKALYSLRASASFTTTLELAHPTFVDIVAEDRLPYPPLGQHVSKWMWRIPSHDLINDGIVLELYGYIVEIKHPKPGEELIAKNDVMLRASIRTLSIGLVRPHGDWGSRKVHIYGELLIGDRMLERLQMFYSGEHANCEAPFFVPLSKMSRTVSNSASRRQIPREEISGSAKRGSPC